MTPEHLRTLYGDVSKAADAKVIDHLDHHCRAFIENSPFFVLATTDGGNLDTSPKGDPKGFVVVEDDHHLVIPDRPGNNRIDGLLNILKNPNVALIFLIPTVNETLRINGTAEIIDDAKVCARHAIKGRVPKTVTRVKVDEVFTHCGKAPLRAGLWKPETWPTKRPVANLYDMVKDHVQGQAEVATKTDEQVIERYNETLY